MKKMFLLFLCCIATAFADDDYGYSNDPGVNSAIQTDQSYQSSQPSDPYRSNNTTYSRIGNMTWGSDGSSYTRIGNQVWGSTGTNCYTVGNQTYCNHR